MLFHSLADYIINSSVMVKSAWRGAGGGGGVALGSPPLSLAVEVSLKLDSSCLKNSDISPSLPACPQTFSLLVCGWRLLFLLFLWVVVSLCQRVFSGFFFFCFLLIQEFY